MEQLIEALRSLEQTQASITGARRLCFAAGADPVTVTNVIADAFRGYNSHTKRLAIFYLFNDVIQYAARDHKVDYLEQGSLIFIPEVTLYLERCPSKDKSPFLRTLDIWAERHVLSKRFVERVKAQWEAANQLPQPDPVPVDTAMEPQPQIQIEPKALMTGDPKMFDLGVISERLILQQKSNAAILDELRKLFPSSENSFHDATTHASKLRDGDPIKALVAGLTAELNVCKRYLLRNFVL